MLELRSPENDWRVAWRNSRYLCALTLPPSPIISKLNFQKSLRPWATWICDLRSCVSPLVVDLHPRQSRIACCVWTADVHKGSLFHQLRWPIYKMSHGQHAIPVHCSLSLSLSLPSHSNKSWSVKAWGAHRAHRLFVWLFSQNSGNTAARYVRQVFQVNAGRRVNDLRKSITTGYHLVNHKSISARL